MNDNYIGFDISKLTIDYAYMKESSKWISRKIDYTKEAMKELITSLPSNSICVMEATGPYYLKLANFLFTHGFRVCVVNPLVIKRFSQMKLLRTKTDKADAKIICSYGKEQAPTTWEPKDEVIHSIRQKLSTQELFIKQRTAFQNKLESLVQDENADKSCTRMVKQEIQNITRKIDKLDEEVENIIMKTYNVQYKLLRTIPGIGRKTAATLIAITSCFELFESHRKLASYIGLCPRIYESGTSVRGKAKICKLGMSRMRQLLYLAALSAIKANKPCEALYNRLVEKGKPKKLALVAVANKLIRQSFGVINNNLPYYEFAA